MVVTEGCNLPLNAAEYQDFERLEKSGTASGDEKGGKTRSGLLQR